MQGNHRGSGNCAEAAGLASNLAPFPPWKYQVTPQAQFVLLGLQCLVSLDSTLDDNLMYQ